MSHSSPQSYLSRRSFLAFSAATAAVPMLAVPGKSGSIPVGLELYSVRDGLSKDLMSTVEGVAKMGYQCVEFYAPYFSWTPAYARQVRAKLDGLGMRCYSTHNDSAAFTGDGPAKALELNKILGTKYVVMAHPGEITSIDGWKHVAELLNQGNAKFRAEGLHAGYHNHDAEFRMVSGQRPMDLLAASTDQSIMLQLDVGTCVEAGADPVAWIQKNPGRIRSLHLKDWSAAKGYHVLFGEGSCPWKQILSAAESGGGAEYYLIEQEGSDHTEMETAELCLENYRKLRA